MGYIMSSCSSVNSFFLCVCQLQAKPQESKLPRKIPQILYLGIFSSILLTKIKVVVGITLRRRISMTFTLRRKPFHSPRPQPSNPLSSSKIRENSQTDHPLKLFQFCAC